MTPAIRVAGLSKRYRDQLALDNVDLEIAPGEFFGLLGPNGAGKTTLISLLAGLARPTHGEAWVMGHHVEREYRAARHALGVVPQELVYDPFFNVREALRMQSGYYGLRYNRAWTDAIIERLGLAEHAHKNLRALSGGMKRRVMVALALVHRPPVIVLDEPTAGVDVGLRQSLWSFIREMNRDGHTIVLTTHYLEEAETLCGRIALMKSGRIVALDSQANLLKHVGGAHCARLALAGTPPTLPGLTAAEGDGQYRFSYLRAEDLQALLIQLASAGVTVSALEIDAPDLEDVFTQMVGA
jgi:ABC-2 type transport system ATP-binding protein